MIMTPIGHDKEDMSTTEKYRDHRLHIYYLLVNHAIKYFNCIADTCVHVTQVTRSD